MANITTPDNVDLVLGHGQCMDGFTSMWLVYLVRGNACEYKEVFYGDPPPDVTGRYVAILDFAYDRDVLEEMAAKAASILVLDHHATNQRKLEGLPYTQFDMQRSGARMTYDWCVEQIQEVSTVDCDAERWRQVAEKLASYVQDRDLWQWKLYAARQISAALAVVPYEMEAWTKFAFRLYDNVTLVINDGAALLAATARQTEIYAQSAQIGKLDEQLLWVCNGPYTHASDLGHLLCARPGPGVAAVWRYDHVKQRLSVSLRSSETPGIDVSKLAEQYGGGGHKHAAGFEIDDWPPILPFTMID